MYIVECPNCHRRFKVAQAFENKRMQCSQCKLSFVGTTVLMNEAPGAPPPAQAPQPEPVGRRRKSQYTGVIMLVGCIFGLVAVIAMVIAAVYFYGNPGATYRDAEGNSITKAEYEAGRRARPSQAPPTPTPTPPPAGQTPEPVIGVKQPPKPAPPKAIVPTQDPKLIIHPPKYVREGVGIGGYQACGTLTNRYPVALRNVTVRAYAGRYVGRDVTYDYVPAGAVIHYSVPVPSNNPEKEQVAVRAVAGEKLGGNVLVWTIDPMSVGEAAMDDTGQIVWTGRIRNSTSTPAKNVTIYCDFFDKKSGLYGGSATGKLVYGKTMGAGLREEFRMVSGKPKLLGYQLLVVRAVGEKY